MVTPETFPEIEQALLHPSEVRHRIGNLLAIVSALTHGTLRNASVETSIIETIDARLIAVSSAMTMSYSGMGAMTVEAVVNAALPVRTARTPLIETAGPIVEVGPDGALLLSLVLGELNLRSRQTGVLQSRSGQIIVDWCLVETGETIMTLRWRERTADGRSLPDLWDDDEMRLLNGLLLRQFGRAPESACENNYREWTLSIAAERLAR